MRYAAIMMLVETNIVEPTLIVGGNLAHEGPDI